MVCLPGRALPSLPSRWPSWLPSTSRCSLFRWATAAQTEYSRVQCWCRLAGFFRCDPYLIVCLLVFFRLCSVGFCGLFFWAVVLTWLKYHSKCEEDSPVSLSVPWQWITGECEVLNHAEPRGSPDQMPQAAPQSIMNY